MTQQISSPVHLFPIFISLLPQCLLSQHRGNNETRTREGLVRFIYPFLLVRYLLDTRASKNFYYLYAPNIDIIPHEEV